MLSLKRLFGAASLFCLISMTGLISAHGEEPVMTVGDKSVTADEMVFLLAQQTGGNDQIARIILGQMSDGDKEQFASQVSDTLMLAQAAELKGLAVNPSVAYQIRWQTANILAQAYVSRISADWDVSENALSQFYDQNSDRYSSSAKVRLRHILLPDESEARTVLLRLMTDETFSEIARQRSRDYSSARKGGDLGWVEMSSLEPEIERIVSSAVKGKNLGPVHTKYGWHIIQITDRREAGRLTFPEAREQVLLDLQQYYLERELKKLRGRFKTNLEVERMK